MTTDEKVYYTDGHRITITSYHLFVGKTVYFLKGITNVNLFTIRANKIPPIMLLVVGLAGILLGSFRLLSSAALEPIYLNGIILTANALVFIAGLILSIVGILWLAVIQDRYAVRIYTAEGINNVVVSPKKNYAIQITDALREAVSAQPVLVV